MGGNGGIHDELMFAPAALSGSQSKPPVSPEVPHFHSGGGWYNASFDPGQAGGWQRVVIDKASTRVEGKPAGWEAVDKVRISGWRGRPLDTECAIANLAPFGGKPEVLVLRADSNVPTAGGEAGEGDPAGCGDLGGSVPQLAE
jgi:hypothetical protein